MRGGFQRGNTIEKCSPLVPFYAPFWALQKGATNVNESIMRKKVIYVDKAEKKNLRLKFRGSENQRILDVKRSLKAGTAIWCEEYR